MYTSRSAMLLLRGTGILPWILLVRHLTYVPWRYQPSSSCARFKEVICYQSGKKRKRKKDLNMTSLCRLRSDMIHANI